MKVAEKIDALRRMTATELRQEHLAVFGEPSGSGNRPYLLRRIAWRIQAQAEGGLSERALARARSLENEADLRMNPPRLAEPALPPDKVAPLAAGPQPPMPGTHLFRDYKGQRLAVRVLPKGFEYEGVVYRSLTAVATAITGNHWNGNRFFKLPVKARCA